MIASDGTAQSGSLNQPGPLIPIVSRILLTAPTWGLKRMIHRSVTATPESTDGKKYNVRQMLTPGIFWFSRIARMNPKTKADGSDKTAKYKVTLSDCQNIGSFNRRL